MIAFKPRCVAAALLLFATAEAGAADLLPPEPPPPPEPVAIGSGWYLRADVTESAYARPADNTRADANDPGLPPLVGLRLSQSSGYGGGVGYRINPWLRLDATLDQRGAAGFRAYSSRSNFTTGANVEAGHLTVLTGLVNLYADLGTWWGLTPYVGGGLGFSDAGLARGYTQTACFVDACDGAEGSGLRTAVTRPNRSVGSLAWALTAGAAYALGGGFSLDAAYRYVDLGRAKGGVDAYGGSTRLKDIAANEFRLGLRYDLGGAPAFVGAGGIAYGN